MSDTILFSQEGAIGTLTFNRPQVFNAMNDELILAFRDVTARILATPGLRVLVLAGAGKAFVAGGDVGVFHSKKERVADEVKPLGDALHDGIMNLRAMPFPVIAKIHGAVAGAGLSIALAADFAIASDDAQFTTAYSRIGLSPDGGSTWFLPRVVGIRKATELIMLSEPLDAAAALAYCLVNKVVPAASLDAEVRQFAGRLAAGPTAAYARAKRLIDQAAHTPIRQQLDDEIACFAECARTDDFKEGVTAFVEKRRPTFTGR